MVRWFLSLFAILFFGGIPGVVALFEVPGTVGAMLAGGVVGVVLFVVLLVNLFFRPKKKKAPRPGALEQPTAPVPTVFPQEQHPVPQYAVAQHTAQPHGDYGVSALPTTPFAYTPTPQAQQHIASSTPTRTHVSSIPIIREDIPFERSGDEEEDLEHLLEDHSTTLHNLRVTHHQWRDVAALTHTGEAAPHLKPRSPEPDPRPSVVAYTPFADEAEMREAIEQSQTLHVPGRQRTMNRRQKQAAGQGGMKDYPNNSSHRSRRGKTNRGGGNSRRYNGETA